MKSKHVKGKGLWRAAASIMAAAVLMTAIPSNLPVYGEELAKEQESQETGEAITDAAKNSNGENLETGKEEKSQAGKSKGDESQAGESKEGENQAEESKEEGNTEKDQTKEDQINESQDTESETKPENNNPVTNDIPTENADGEQNGQKTEVSDESKPLDQKVPMKTARVAGSETEFKFKNGVITQYIGNETDVEIPSDIGGVAVTGIGASAFSYSDIENVSMPDTIKTIGEDAFSCSFYLESVSFHGQVPSIGRDAFYQCGVDIGLTFHCPSNFEDEYDVALADWIYDWSGNYTLENDLDPYEGEEPSVPGPEEYLEAVNDSSGGVIIKGLKSGSKETSITIPETLNGKNVTQIKEGAFKDNTKIETVTIEAGITSIGNRTFYGCSSLQTITFPDTLSSMGDEAFYNCRKLNNVTFPDCLSEIGKNAFYQCSVLESADLSKTSMPAISDNTFEGCGNLGAAVLPEGLQIIGQYAFYKCNAIEEIILPQSLKRIGQGAFQYTHLTEVEIPAGVELIGNREFAAEAFWCDGLEKIEVSENNLSYMDVEGVLYTKDGKTLLYYPNGRMDTVFNIPEGVEEISGYAFKVPSGQRQENWDSTKGNNLKTIVFPAALKKVGNGAFAQRTLDSITITPNIEWGTYVLDNCKVKTIEIAEGVTEIPNNFFYGASGFEELTLPASLKRIGNSAFDRFPLETIELPEGLEEIGEQAFECSKLTSINIPKSVKAIGDRAFYLNKSLTEVAFEEGSALKNTGAFTFNSCSQLKHITLPYGVEVINNGCFSSCDSLEYVGIPSTVTTLEDFVFAGSGIRTMELTDSIRHLGTGVFRSSLLENVKLPASLETMGTCTFEWCRDLEKVSFPDDMKLKSLPTDTFFYCVNLTGLVLPASMARTEPCSLSYCESLEKVEYKNENLQRSVFDCFAVNLSSYFGFGEWDGENYDLYVPADTAISKENTFTVNTDITVTEADETERLYNQAMSYADESGSTKTRSASAASANCGCAGGNGIFKFAATISPKFTYVLTQSPNPGNNGTDSGNTPARNTPSENTPAGNTSSGNSSSESSSYESRTVQNAVSANAGNPVNVTGGPSTTRSDGKEPAPGSWTKAEKGWRFNYRNDRANALGWEYVIWNGVPGWYYFDKEGYMMTGWIEDNGRKYYLNQPEGSVMGQMAEGWNLLEGKWYYFNTALDGTRGALLKDTVTPDGYRVDGDGTWNGL